MPVLLWTIVPKNKIPTEYELQLVGTSSTTQVNSPPARPTLSRPRFYGIASSAPLTLDLSLLTLNFFTSQPQWIATSTCVCHCESSQSISSSSTTSEQKPKTDTFTWKYAAPCTAYHKPASLPTSSSSNA
jgi:hypothetical protein